MTALAFDAVIIGSGVAGLSTAMQLGLRGKRVLVVEARGLASGATSRAAGLLGQMRSTVDATRLLMDSVEILHDVESRIRRRIYHQTGSVRVAQTPDRVVELRRDVATACTAGLRVEEVPRADLAGLVPCMRCDDVLCASYCPSDGYLDPAALAGAYIEVGRQAGVEFLEHTPVESLFIEHGRVEGVRARGQTVHAPVVVNAAGPWAYFVAELASQHLPTAGIAHYYFTTMPASGVRIRLESPTIRDRENRIYARPKDGGLRVGCYERCPQSLEMDQLPASFSMADMTAGKTHPAIIELIEGAMRRFPAITRDTPIDIRGGVMAFTPDGQPLLGRMPGVEGLFHCAGFCGHGVSQSAGIGRLMADLVLTGVSSYDLKQLEADRFADIPAYRDRAQVTARCLEQYANYYEIAARGSTMRPGRD